MRPIALALVALALAASTTAWAGSSNGTDPEGDENSWPVVDSLDCRAPAIDIVGLRVESGDGLLTARLGVLDLADEGIHCDDAFGRSSTSTGSASHRVELRQPLVCDVTCWSEGPVVRFTTHTTPLEPRSACATVHIDEETWTACIGDFAIEGSTLVWTVPLQGPVSDGDDARTYDLSGLPFQVEASSVGGDVGVTGLMFDYAEAPGITL